MAQLTINVISRAGLDLTALAVAAGAGGDKIASTGAEFLAVVNGAGTPVTVTLVMQATLDGQAPTNRTVSVTNAHTAVIGPFPTGIYNDAQGNTNITYSSTTTVTVCAFRLGS